MLVRLPEDGRMFVVMVHLCVRSNLTLLSILIVIFVSIFRRKTDSCCKEMYTKYVGMVYDVLNQKKKKNLTLFI